MRVRRLDLTRYGRFTDSVIDFGEAPADGPDLHVIYGPNEAGKSTTFAAVLDLIFGIHAHSPYSFLHPYATMRIGAVLENAGQARQFVRIKKPQNSLLDSEERPIPEAAIRAELGGMDRAVYETMFFLDDDTLEKGGDDILASEGELGQLLFAASAGLSDLGKRLSSIKGEADAFYKYRSRTGRLGDLKTRLAELKAEREAIDVLASEYRDLTNERDRLVDAYDAANAERTETVNRVETVRRTLAALPRLEVLRRLENELGAIQIVRPSQPGWKEELPRLERRLFEIAADKKQSEENRDRVTHELLDAAVDPLALKVGARMVALEDIKARYITAVGDIPKLRSRMSEVSVDAALARLGKKGAEDPEAIVLDTITVGGFQQLIETRSGIEAGARLADIELEKAKLALAHAESALDPYRNHPSLTRPEVFKALADGIVSHRDTSLEIQISSLEQARADAERFLGDAVRQLLPWNDELQDPLANAFADRSEIGRWLTAFEENRKTGSQAEADVLRIGAELRRLETEVDAHKSIVGPTLLQDPGEVRANRDSAWSEHRTLLNLASADSFEATMRLDDLVTSERIGRVSDLERLNLSAVRLATQRADFETATLTGARAAAANEAIRDEIATRFEAWIGHGWRMEPSQLEAWMLSRESALAAREKLLGMDVTLSDAQIGLVRAKTELERLLTDTGVTASADMTLPALVGLGRSALDRHDIIISLAADVRRLREMYDERSVTAKVFQREDATWMTEWDRLGESCWLGTLATKPGTVATKEIIAASAELAQALLTRAGLADRIEKMMNDQLNFESEVIDLCGATGIPTTTNPLEMAHQLENIVREAQRNVDRREKLQADLDKIEETLRDLIGEQRMIDERSRQMTDHFDVDSLEDVGLCIEGAERRATLTSELEEVQREIVTATRTVSFEDATRSLDDIDRDALEAEETRLKGLAEDQDRRCHELFHQCSQAIDRLEAVGGDGKVAQLEEARRTLLLDIEDQATSYLELRAGTIAAEHALALYRDRHRSSMMAKASEAFETISRGDYSGLAVQPGKDGETLIALSRGGGSKAADQLSKGTRFQLYLALRVAGYHEFVRSHVPVPFIADDIMETFDDFRAEEAFRLFAGMAEVGQVIYMTHHRHLTDIAKQVCQSVRIHDLDTIIKQGLRDAS